MDNLDYLEDYAATDENIAWHLEQHGLPDSEMAEADRAEIHTLYDLAEWLGY
jgi:hypothetical protein